MVTRLGVERKEAMHLISVQTGVARASVVSRNKATGIAKEPVPSAEIRVDGLMGDVIVDQQNHGGPDQAVYIYTQGDYDFWEKELDRTFSPGFFGENLTFSHDETVGWETIRIGDRYALGSVVLEVTAPRIPCGIFADRLGLANFVDTFRQANRPGMYCRVISEGRVEPGDLVQVNPAPRSNLSLVQSYRLHYDRSADLDLIREAMKSPVSARLRADYERRIVRQA